MGLNIEARQLDGWIPIRVYWNGEQPFVDWCWVGEKRFTEPFMDHTIDVALKLPFSSLFRPQTPIQMLEERHFVAPGLEPTGFIFHMSRCGSTLVSQMLGRLPMNIVVSEAGSIDSVLRIKFRDRSVTDHQRADWLRWLVSALGQRRFGNEKHLFIKFDSWTTLDLPLIHLAYPSVPWIFVYRDPIEVLVSQLTHRGAHMVPGALEPEIFGFALDDAFRMHPEEYCARVLASLCRAALDHHRRSPGLLVNYRQLPGAVYGPIARFLGLLLSDSDIETMQSAAFRNAKNPDIEFLDDSRTKQKEATEQLRFASEKWLSPVYQELEADRLAQETTIP